MWLRPPPWRLSAGSVSATPTATAMNISPASAATTQNDTRQWENCRINPPMSGPTIGAIPETPATTFIARTS
jgi:hypothetical protein